MVPNMNKHIALITYLVRDYDKAIRWFRAALDFVLFEDTDMGGGKRWVVMGPATESGARFLLAKAATPEQAAHIGQAAGGRVAFFLYTDDFAREAARMADAKVRFLEAPRAEAYGTVAVFEDLYGNRWDLLQPKG
jgi:catechol 2,3-dioxygenase-like lactoylglutathione lyase family enzyme